MAEPPSHQELRKRVMADARTLDDWQFALTYFKEADELWEQLGDRPARQAIFKAGVIAYCRPFVPGAVRMGKSYPIRDLVKAGAFDREVHSHLLKLRNLFLAHTDADAYASRFAIVEQAVDQEDGTRVNNVLALIAIVYGWAGLEDRSYIGKIISHINLAGRALHKAMSGRLAVLEEALVADRDALGATTAGPTFTPPSKNDDGSSTFALQDLAKVSWKAPDMEIGGPEYAYRMNQWLRLGSQVQTNAGPEFKNGDAIWVQLTDRESSLRPAAPESPLTSQEGPLTD